MPPSKFDSTQYTDTDFKLEDLLSRLKQYKENLISKKISKEYSHGDGHLRKPETLLTTYYLLKSYLPEDSFAGKRVFEQLIDGRLKTFYAKDLEGIRIIECRFEWYDNRNQIIFVRENVKGKHLLKLKFANLNTFTKAKRKIFKLPGNNIKQLHHIFL